MCVNICLSLQSPKRTFLKGCIELRTAVAESLMFMALENPADLPFIQVHKMVAEWLWRQWLLKGALGCLVPAKVLCWGNATACWFKGAEDRERERKRTPYDLIVSHMCVQTGTAEVTWPPSNHAISHPVLMCKYGNVSSADSSQHHKECSDWRKGQRQRLHRPTVNL